MTPADAGPALVAGAEPLVVEAQPEQTGGRRIGVLLSHGFTGSPWSMKPWGEHLAALGYGVAVPRLPGHGTTWQEMNRTRWADWYGEITRTFDALLAGNDVVVIGGLSMGGTLTLRLAADRADDVAGLMLVNPAVSSTRFDIKLLPVAKHLVGGFPAISGDIKRLPNDGEAAYDRTPLKALHSLVQAWTPLRADLGRITCPVLYFRSTVDHVVDDSSEPIVLAGVSSTDVTTVRLPESYHVATLDNDAPTIFADSADFVARVAGSAGSSR